MKQNHHNTNENLKQLTPETLIFGVDISKNFHVARAIDFRGMELDKTHSFSNHILGFREFHQQIRHLQNAYNKTHVIVGVEPTGPYGYALIQFLRSHDIQVVLTLGYQVAKAKELDDNTPSKNDYKDALTIAGLVRDGRFRKLREFEPSIYELREAMSLHRQLTKDITRTKCRIDNWLCQYFPEFPLVFKDWTKKTAYATLSAFPMPVDICRHSAEEIVRVWRSSGVIKGVGLKKASQLKLQARHSIGLVRANELAAVHLRALLTQYELYLSQVEELWTLIDQIVKSIPLFHILSQIPAMGKVAACGIVAELGDVSAFSHPKQLSRLAGLSLKESSSGGKRGVSEITKRGRPHLRHSLYLAVIGLLKSRTGAFWVLHQYHTKHKETPLKPMQSVIALCNKLLRVIYGMAISGQPYDPELVLSGIATQEAA